MARSRFDGVTNPTIEIHATRRTVLAGLLSALVAGRAAASSDRESFNSQLAALQADIGGRIGVHVLDTGSTLELGFNDRDRYAMCSTFKMLLAAAVLARVDAGKLSLDQRINYGPADMLPNAPVTAAKLSEGAMSV